MKAVDHHDIHKKADRWPGALDQVHGIQKRQVHQASEWEDCKGISVEDDRDGLGSKLGPGS